MLFLMNDVVLDLDLPRLGGSMRAGRVAPLPLPAVLKLGRELFAEEPLLPRTRPERARRLAMLIVARASEVNAALFEAPRAGCRPHEVGCRLAQAPLEVMAGLYVEERSATLTPAVADRQVWRRMAA